MKKRKVLAMLVAFAMTFSLAACGSSGGNDDQANSDANTESGSDEDAIPDNEITGDPSAKDAFVVWAWNTDFTTLQDLLVEKYPDLKDRLVFVNCGGSSYYQDKIDALFEDQRNELYPDMMLLEVGYVQKYVQSDYLMSLKDLGITDADLADQYQYTKDIVTDSNGVLKGVSWQGCPGVLFYNREAAKEVLGSDDPADVQEYVKDWDTFNDTAAKLKDAGYKITSSANDTYRVYSNNVTSKWVVDGKINIDDNIMKWVDQTKTFTEKGYNNKSSLWDNVWQADQGPKGNVFGFFYSTWGINFTLLGNALETPVKEGGKEEVGNGIYGDYAVCQGPQSYYWGGTWICAAAGTDNPNLIKEIMQTMTCDKDTEVQITKDTQDYTNTISGMNELANSNFKSDFLGGQNHIKLFAEAAPKINMKNISAYDQGLNEEFQKAMKDYFDGNVTKDKALDNFYKAATEKYPNLTH